MIPPRKPSLPRLMLEGRNEARFAARLPVTLLSSKTRDELVTQDVSFRGMFIETEHSPALRQLVRMSVIAPISGAELILHGMVVRVVEPGTPEAAGMGVELYAVDREARAVWWGLVRFVRDRLDALERGAPPPLPPPIDFQSVQGWGDAKRPIAVIAGGRDRNNR